MVDRGKPLDRSHQSHGTLSALTCEFLFLCSGYYNYDEGYSPRFAGSEDFVGPIIHPQHWPEDLDYDAKNIVVIGSGATAVTLVPALADSGAKHVTMLQRSPTYIVSQPDRDGIAEKLNRWLPETMAYTAVRWKNVLRQAAVYSACQKWPRRMRKMFLSLIQRQLPEGTTCESTSARTTTPGTSDCAWCPTATCSGPFVTGRSRW